MPIMEISIIPLGTRSPSISKYIANALGILKREKGIKYRLTSMGTIIEANSSKRLLSIARKMHKMALNNDVRRIVTTLKIDERRDKNITMESKIRSVKKRLRNKK